MIKAIVIDDEIYIRKLIISHIEKQNGILLLGQCGSVKEGKVLIESCNPDIVFLDINLSDGSGFDLLNQLKEIKFKIVFITSYSQHAIKAIKYGAFDYILKPIDSDEFTETIERVLKEQETYSLNKERVAIAEEVINKKKSRITIRFSDSMRIVQTEDIIYCQSDSGYTIFFLKDGEKIVASKGLKDFEMLLPKDQFLRVHKSYLVNTSFIKEYRSEGCIILTAGASIPVAVRRKDDVISLFLGE